MTLHQTLDLAFQHHRARRLAEAEELYRQILAEYPNNPDALHLLGMLAFDTGQLSAAAELVRRAIAAHPNAPDYHRNLGLIFRAARKYKEAADAYRSALRLKPDMIDAHNELGMTLKAMGDLQGAIQAYRAALKLNPNLAEVHNNLANALKDSRLLEPAMEEYRAAIRLQPELPQTYSNLAGAFSERGELDQAIEMYRKAISLNPADPVPHSNLLFTLQFHPGFDAKAIFDEHKRWNQRHAEPLRQSMRSRENDRSPQRRLRIGYVGAHFREHCQSYFAIPLLSNHDHEQFEVFCYADSQQADAVTQRIRGYTDSWRETLGMPDTAVAEMIRADQIDILVDLTMHMINNRLLVFARRPAPVQVTWLAYPGTTGLTTIDYRLTDPFLDPPGNNDEFYSEQSIRLDNTFWCYDPLTSQPTVNTLPADRHGRITFGSLNTFCKVNDPTLQLWSQVLHAVPDSKLLLLAPEGAPRQHVLQQLNVSADRVEFIDRQPRLKYLELYHRIDIGLDTFPYNGHTTSLDALWMGVPTVSLSGQTAVSRAGLSQASNLGLSELVTPDRGQFVELAKQLAGDTARLRELRATLRDRMTASPLMDGARFARDVEAAYHAMWQRWCSEDRVTRNERDDA